MPFDISAIKKLPIKERLRIIDELWEGIEAEHEQGDESVVNEEEAVYGVEENAEEESPEIIAMLEERWSKYKRGEGKSYSIDEVKEMLDQKIERKKKDRKNK
jgi:hypothetical protein